MSFRIISLISVFLFIDKYINMKSREKVYQKPKVKEKKITLNMFYSELSFFGDESLFLASCYTPDCTPCGNRSCGSDCAC